MRFKIFTIPHTLFAALHLIKQLQKLGYAAELANEIRYDDGCTYIIYNAANLQCELPPRYIVYQTEIATSHWFTPKYFSIIKGALAVWDYTAVNVPKYKSYNKNIHIVSPGIEPVPRIEKDIDVLFYGWLKGSPRRSAMLQRIGKQIKVHVITDLLGADMWKVLSRSKVVLNIHYYNNSPLELFRLNEALSHNCHVVSELPYSPVYRDFVHFARNEQELISICKKCVNLPFEYKLEPLDNLECIKLALKNI